VHIGVRQSILSFLLNMNPGTKALPIVLESELYSRTSCVPGGAVTGLRINSRIPCTCLGQSLDHQSHSLSTWATEHIMLHFRDNVSESVRAFLREKRAHTFQ
jgi:hypothetical protein